MIELFVIPFIFKSSIEYNFTYLFINNKRINHEIKNNVFFKHNFNRK